MGKKTVFVCIAFLLGACTHEKVEWMNLDDYTDLDPATSFVPFRSEICEVNLQAAGECLLPDGTSAVETLTRTTGFSGAQLLEGLLSTLRHKSIKSYCGSYLSTDMEGKPIRLSGRITIPADGKVSRIMLVSHYTMTDDASVPSRRLQLESLFAARGLAVIDADYLGYGLTRGVMHPYLVPSQACSDVINMYRAALPFLEAIGAKPEHDDIFLLGYSQGGAVTLSVHQEIEQNHPDIRIRLNMAGGGPFDLCLTYDKMVEADFTQIPVAVPLIIRSMKYSCRLDNLDLADYFQPSVMENLGKWIDSKDYSVAMITEMLGTTKLSDILTESAMNKVNDSMSDLYLAMMSQSVINPDNLLGLQAPLYVFHSMDDNVVPFDNSEKLLDYFQGFANVTYNFGHYGNHTKGMLRFLQCCVDLLEKNGDI